MCPNGDRVRAVAVLRRAVADLRRRGVPFDLLHWDGDNGVESQLSEADLSA